MSQQHTQFEEEFRDGPPPTAPYQSGYTGTQSAAYNTVSAPSAGQPHMSMPGQKLLAYDLHTGRAPNAGQRLALAIVSIVFVFVMFLIALITVAATASLVIFFAVIFTIVVVILNVIFNRRH